MTRKLRNLFLPSQLRVVTRFVYVHSTLLRTGLYSFFCGLLFFACATAPPGAEDIKKAEAHYKLGISYIAKDQLNEAFIEFQKAIKLNPQNRDAFNYLGYISTRFKKYNNAISYYKRAISIDPNYSEVMNNLGVVYAEIENWDEAIKYFKMSLNNPVYATPERAFLNMGFAYYKKGDYQKAQDALKEALTRYPDFPQAFYMLGLVYGGLGNDEGAIEEFKKAIDIIPNYIVAHWELAKAYLAIGERDKAVEHFKIVAQKDANTTRGKEALEYIELLEK